MDGDLTDEEMAVAPEHPEEDPSSSRSASGDSSDEGEEQDEDVIIIDDDDEEGNLEETPIAQPTIVTNGSTAPSPSANTGASPSTSTQSDTAALNAYIAAAANRRSPFLPTTRAVQPKSYHVDPVFTIPNGCQVYSLAVPPCCSSLYTGGSDGFIRRYGLHVTLNGTTSEHNLTMKPGGPHGAQVDAKQPVLLGYYENEEPGSWVDDLAAGLAGDESKIRWGPKHLPVGTNSQSPVYSLAVQKDELWGLSGTGAGTINLFTIRHDEGHIRHVFPSSSDAKAGHQPGSPVSVIVLNADETSFLSGGWDGRILEWDLNTGRVVRTYLGHDSQVSSIAWRPRPESGHSRSSNREGGVAMAPSPASSTSSSTGVAAALVQSTPTGTPSTTNGNTSSAPPQTIANGIAPPAATIAGDDASEADADGEVDADGEADDEFLVPPVPAPPAASSVKVISAPGQPIRLAPKVNASDSFPLLGVEGLPPLSGDAFVSTGIDGKVLVWDRKVKNGESGLVRKLEGAGKSARWCTSACWSNDGQQVFIGRRSSSVEIFDIRHSTPSQPIVRTLQMPPASGPVSALATLPSGNHLLTASSDNVRIWSLDAPEGKGKLGYKIIPGHQGGMISSIVVDPTARFLFSASGNRGWDGPSSESVIISDIQAVA